MSEPSFERCVYCGEEHSIQTFHLAGVEYRTCPAVPGSGSYTTVIPAPQTPVLFDPHGRPLPPANLTREQATGDHFFSCTYVGKKT